MTVEFAAQVTYRARKWTILGWQASRCPGWVALVNCASELWSVPRSQRSPRPKPHSALHSTVMPEQINMPPNLEAQRPESFINRVRATMDELASDPDAVLITRMVLEVVAERH